MLIAAAAVALTAMLGAASPASAADECWRRLINDWYDGRIDGSYPPKCYRDAIAHLPADVVAYSDAREQIQRHLLQAIRASGGKEPELIPPQKGPKRNGDDRENGNTGTGGDDDTPGGGEAAGDDDDGALGFFDRLSPSNADSVPLPLLILAALALLLLMAAAVGFTTRRLQARKVRLAASGHDPPHG